MGGHASALGEDTGGSAHALDVLGRGLLAHDDHLPSLLGGGDGGLRREHDSSHGGAGRRRQSLGHRLGGLLRCYVEYGVQNLVKLRGRHAHHGGLLVDHALGEHVHGHLDCGQAGALAYAALQHPELAFLDGELNILHIVEMLLQLPADLVKLRIDLGHRLLEGLEILVMFVLGSLVERVGGADTCDHVLSLGVDQPFAVELVVSGGGVAGERHAGSG